MQYVSFASAPVSQPSHPQFNQWSFATADDARERKITTATAMQCKKLRQPWYDGSATGSKRSTEQSGSERAQREASSRSQSWMPGNMSGQEDGCDAV